MIGSMNWLCLKSSGNILSRTCDCPVVEALHETETCSLSSSTSKQKSQRHHQPSSVVINLPGQLYSYSISGWLFSTRLISQPLHVDWCEVINGHDMLCWHGRNESCHHRTLSSDTQSIAASATCHSASSCLLTPIWCLCSLTVHEQNKDVNTGKNKTVWIR